MSSRIFNDRKVSSDVSSSLDYFSLLKPRVMSLAIFTALVGQLLALGENSIHPILFIISLFSIALGAGAAGCINMWYDRDIDAKMIRTNQRPIPKGLIEPEEALTLGIILSIISVMLLILAANYLSGILLASSILFYIFIYTIWLKRKTYYNIVIGGAAGALPPVIGWTSVSNEVSMLPIILFLLIFVWTPPHFWALSLYINEDYKKVNIPMLPVVVGKEKTIKSIIRYSFYLYSVAILPFIFNLSGKIYLYSSVLLSFIFLILAYRLDKDDMTKAKNLFKYSILYLFLIFFILVIDSFIKY